MWLEKSLLISVILVVVTFGVLMLVRKKKEHQNGSLDCRKLQDRIVFLETQIESGGLTEEQRQIAMDSVMQLKRAFSERCENS